MCLILYSIRCTPWLASGSWLTKIRKPVRKGYIARMIEHYCASNSHMGPSCPSCQGNAFELTNLAVLSTVPLRTLACKPTSSDQATVSAVEAGTRVRITGCRIAVCRDTTQSNQCLHLSHISHWCNIIHLRGPNLSITWGQMTTR